MKLRLAAAAVLAILLSVVLDHWAFTTLVAPRIYESDAGRLLRIVGFLPTWIIVGLMIGLHDRHARPAIAWKGWRRGGLLVLSPMVAGLSAEILKLVFRRERPLDHAGAYVFRAFSDRTFKTGGLGLPSSHTLVAFGAAAMLALLFPRARWVAYALATGCALSRVLAQAHFLSDVTVAAVIGVGVAHLVWAKTLDRGSEPAL